MSQNLISISVLGVIGAEITINSSACKLQELAAFLLREKKKKKVKSRTSNKKLRRCIAMDHNKNDLNDECNSNFFFFFLELTRGQLKIELYEFL